RLLKKVLLEPAPASEALQAGLNLLRQADMRKQARTISAPVLLLAGVRDTLLPKRALPEMADLFENAMFEHIEKAGHAPFLSHREETLKSIHTFLMDIQEMK
ncbi:MAG: pimeloyl-[acyl-carrier protein] methyl ester esterase, partial [Gammaproteobacteria bacterium]|nr:pimeloyl-[acyl-carrier protein] methyl ester esterase [Gammaproteobacteria bacterium]